MSIEYTVPSIILGLPLILLPIDLKFIYSKLAFLYFHAKLQQKDCSHKNNQSFFNSFNCRHTYREATSAPSWCSDAGLFLLQNRKAKKLVMTKPFIIFAIQNRRI